MEENFFPNRAFFWSFTANILFIFGIFGYLFMDTLGYIHLNIFNSLLTNIIYIILASIFVINATLQFFVTYHMNRHIQRYYTMILSSIFDEIASHAYFLGAILTTMRFINPNTIWICNIIGVYGFVIGAALNMMIPGTSCMSILADYFNLLGALLYLLAIIITRMPVTKIIVLLGDVVYFIDSILYMISWFEERRLAMIRNGQYISFK